MAGAVVDGFMGVWLLLIVRKNKEGRSCSHRHPRSLTDRDGRNKKGKRPLVGMFLVFLIRSNSRRWLTVDRWAYKNGCFGLTGKENRQHNDLMGCLVASFGGKEKEERRETFCSSVC
ncbi:unnamed protein product [Lactuca virosa]|uniref:Uncharacterized protein n=1 Tax=Lactuca virosa TaxID=75947 RepID=A0AAU9N319_9ASTR|nr:unnamed protein product [Lactuca virosa]